MEVLCPECGTQSRYSPAQRLCACGGAWEPAQRMDFDPAAIDASDRSIWRYRRFYGLDFERPAFSLGEGGTPLVPLTWDGREVLFKLEFMAPTGSFKDRGTATMMNVLAHEGVRRVAEDSSGNAGASVAAYAARAGVRADIFVPTTTSSAKRTQIAVYGAAVHAVPGARTAATEACWQLTTEGDVALASHVYHPGWLVGQQSEAWELWEQLGHQVPDWYVAPTGQGGHLLGIWFGFRRLLAAGLIQRLPRLVVAQSAAVAPVCRAFEAGLDTIPAIQPTVRSVAEGLAITRPVRGRRLLQAIRETGGTCVAVEDEAILDAQRHLAHQGLFVEPTSATAVASLRTVLGRAAPDDTVVVSLTGSGLKGVPQLAGGQSPVPAAGQLPG